MVTRKAHNLKSGSSSLPCASNFSNPFCIEVAADVERVRGEKDFRTFNPLPPDCDSGGFFIMDRKAFNFYRSYYDICLKLNDEDRYQFLMAVIEMQFTGKCRKLSGMAEFAFVSQKHSIEAQILGFEHGKKGGYNAHNKAPYKGGYKAPYLQEKGQVQEQEQVKVYGTPSSLSFGVSAKYIHESPCKVYDNGFKEYVNIHQMGNWFVKDYMAELFWKEWNGKLFSDHRHVNTVMLNINNNKNG